MPKYDLDALGPQEFERLSQDLATKIVGPGVKVYGMGSDAGREATFQGRAPYPSELEQWDGYWIFQAKFHDKAVGQKNARAMLLKELKSELTKVSKKYKHRCDNYILITNVILTSTHETGTKDKIDNKIIPEFSDKIKNIHVWGADEVCRFLDLYPDIRRSYIPLLLHGDLIAGILGIMETREPKLDEIVKLYCQFCYNNEQFASLRDSGDVEDDRIKIQKVFIDLDVQVKYEVEHIAQYPIWIQEAYYPERTSALSYLLDDSIPSLVLIGGPGGGKTTLCQYVSQIYRARLIGKLNDLSGDAEMFEKCIPRIPFRIILRDYVEWLVNQANSGSLFDFLALNLSRAIGGIGGDVVTKYIHAIVKSSPIILVLDGLDEIPEKKLRQKVMDSIISFIDQVKSIYQTNLRVIASTRPYGYTNEFDDFHYLHLTLQKLSPDKALEYSENWIQVREHEQPDHIRDTFSICLNDNVISLLTKTPLQVTILLLIIRERGVPPPKQREDLFQSFMDTIYRREQKKRPDLLRSEPDRMYGLHKYIGYILHKRAEKGMTAALMTISEFKEKTREYLTYRNPIINESQLEDELEQIIREVGERLVLIESTSSGQIGFGLTSTREFFAAAHLVDTAKDTSKRNARFKVIVTQPHWRNVALFFAGRIGRVLPGEIANLVNVCRNIDTKVPDTLLKRGGELVAEMINDRVFRDEDGELTAVDYVISALCDSQVATDRFLEKLEVQKYKSQIHIFLNKLLNNLAPENLKHIYQIHNALIGFDDDSRYALQRGGNSDQEEIKVWALTEGIKNRINDKWIVNLFENLSHTISNIESLANSGIKWNDFRCYLDHNLSSKAIGIILAVALTKLKSVPYHRELFDEFSEGMILKKEQVKTENENYILFWAVCQLIFLRVKYNESVSYSPGSYHHLGYIPFFCIANKYLKDMHMIEKLIQIATDDNEYIRAIVDVFDFLSHPYDVDKFVQLMKNSKIVMSFEWLFGIPSKDIFLIKEHHKGLLTLHEHIKKLEQYQDLVEEFNEVINRQSDRIPNHRNKLYLWIKSRFDPKYKNYLDEKIADEILNWIDRRNLREVLPYCKIYYYATVYYSDTPRNPFPISGHDLELANLELDLIESDLAKEKDLPVFSHLDYENLYNNNEECVSRARSVFDKVLTKYLSNEIITVDDKILNLCNFGIVAGVLNEKNMAQLYPILVNSHVQPFSRISKLNYPREQRQITFLKNMIRGNNKEAARLAAFLLLDFVNYKRIEDIWIGEKYWEFAKDKNDPWKKWYILGMSVCMLKWKSHWREWFNAISESDTETLNYWNKFIEETTYESESKDSRYFVRFLLAILQSKLPQYILISASRHLENISLYEPISDKTEKLLGLPLPEKGYYL